MGSNNNVPAFLTKLWTLVEDTSTDDMICWDPVSTDVKLHLMVSVVQILERRISVGMLHWFVIFNNNMIFIRNGSQDQNSLLT